MILLAVNRIENVYSSFFRVHPDDIVKLIQFDLLYVYIYFGCTLFVERRVGVTQGNPISKRIADIVLSCVEGINRCIFYFKSKEMVHICDMVGRWHLVLHCLFHFQGSV